MGRPVLLKTNEVAVIHAVDTLTKISEMGFEGGVLSHAPGIPHLVEAVEWLHQKNAEKVLKLVREDFRIILDYLKKYDMRGEGVLIDPQTLEGMESIMLVVADAAEKVDKYSQTYAPKIKGLFWSSVKETKEFRDLLRFYHRKIEPLANKESVMNWVSTLPIGQLMQAAIGKGGGEISIQHHIVDLEALRKDHEYELLFIRREDGSRFFSPKLLRSLRLICHFEEKPQGPKQGEVFRDISLWNEAQLRLFAKTWTQSVWSSLNQFFQSRVNALDNELVVKASHMALALMMANTLSHVVPLSQAKTVCDYLKDFHGFLHDLLGSQDYGRMIAYRPRNQRGWDWSLYKLVQDVTWVYYTAGRISKDLFNLHQALIQQSLESGADWEFKPGSSGVGFSGRMWDRYSHLQAATKEFITEPLVRDINLLESDIPCAFDPAIFSNYPFKAFDLQWKNTVIPIYRLPFPVHQQSINKASLNDEFKAFLREVHDRGQGRVLVLDLQNTLSWKDSARSEALHELAHSKDFADVLIPLTFNREGDFYHQIERELDEEEETHSFLKRFGEALVSPMSGYILPEKWKSVDFTHFIDLLLSSVEDGFLFQKATVTKFEKMEIIDLVQHLLLLKAIDDYKPSFVYITCKDGLDLTLPFLTEFYMLLKTLNQRSVEEAEEQYISTLLFAPPLLVRGRLIFQERFQRSLALIRFLERWHEEAGEEVTHGLLKALQLLLPGEYFRSVAVVPIQRWASVVEEARESEE